jgi:hypothetical protein
MRCIQVASILETNHDDQDEACVMVVRYRMCRAGCGRWVHVGSQDVHVADVTVCGQH